MMQSEAEEAGFWNAIAEAPQDELPRLVFADWLEERNHPRRDQEKADVIKPLSGPFPISEAWEPERIVRRRGRHRE